MGEEEGWVQRANTKSSSCSDEMEIEELRAEQSLSIIHYTVRPGKSVAKFSDNLIKSKYLTSSMLGYFWHSTNYKIQMRRLLCFKNMN